jgi:hypothetical protein
VNAVSYKSIDLQASLPRAAELTPLAHQQQQKSATEQSLLGQQAVKSAEQQAQRKTKTESAAKGEITDRQPRGGGRQPAKGQRKADATVLEEDNRSEHPFKGKHIDFMG